MNQPRPESNEQQSDQMNPGAGNLRDRCMMYLLGEMPQQEREQFESQLGEPEIAEALLRESELISQASQTSWTSPALHSSDPALPSSDPALHFSEDQLEGRHERPARTLAGVPAVALLAIAVTTLLAFGLSFLSQSQDESTSVAQVAPSTMQVAPELDLDVAHQWAEASSQWDFASQSDVFTEVSSAEDLTPIENEAGESWDWMLSAYEATSVEELSNDG